MFGLLRIKQDCLVLNILIYLKFWVKKGGWRTLDLRFKNIKFVFRELIQFIKLFPKSFYYKQMLKIKNSRLKIVKIINSSRRRGNCG